MQPSLSSPRQGMAGRAKIVSAIQAMCLQRLAIKIDSPAADLFETGLVDSIGLVEVIGFIETRYKVQLPMEELTLDSLRSLDSIAEVVEKCMAGAGTGAHESRGLHGGVE